MNTPYSRAPHVGAQGWSAQDSSPHAALLIDFDNVTMGRGSNLSSELKSLLNSDIIKGKVAVQRAYADWRRYPQYIVPLSEASIDLIFAPAYGSSKKNATDIRMAIDALELVFVRPEIGTFILLTGDSDFSSVVLKLKEYGKYVIGVGIQESSSDILVQNCDEYYSYTAITGLTKTSEAERAQFDPWVLVTKAVDKMVERGDVMRSDRLKQVMREIDPGFNEGEHGFSKFSRFLADASSRGLIDLKRMENGQYEVAPGGSGRGRKSRASRAGTPATAVEESPLEHAYELLCVALGELTSDGRLPARDSDVKRRILVLEPAFDEAELGFPKFSRFLQAAAESSIVELRRKEPEGYTEVILKKTPSSPSDEESRPARRGARGDEASRSTSRESASARRRGRNGDREKDEGPSDGPSRPRGRRTRPRARPTAEDTPAPAEETPAERAAEAVDEGTAESRKSDRGRRSRRGSKSDESTADGRSRREGKGRGRKEKEAVPSGEPEIAAAAPVETATASASDKADDARRATRRVPERDPEPAPDAASEPAAQPVAEPEEPTPTVTATSPPAPQVELGRGLADDMPVIRAVPESTSSSEGGGRKLHPRQQRRRRGGDGPPPIFEGQGVPGARAGRQRKETANSPPADERKGTKQTEEPKADIPADIFNPGRGVIDPEALGLPTDPGAIVRYLTHRYKGVGARTAESIVEVFGDEVFEILHREPRRVTEVLSENRGAQLIQAWRADLARRSAGEIS